MNGFAARRTILERSLQLSAAKQEQFLWHWIASVSKGHVICQRGRRTFQPYRTQCSVPAGEITQRYWGCWVYRTLRQRTVTDVRPKGVRDRHSGPKQGHCRGRSWLCVGSSPRALRHTEGQKRGDAPRTGWIGIPQAREALSQWGSPSKVLQGPACSGCLWRLLRGERPENLHRAVKDQRCVHSMVQSSCTSRQGRGRPGLLRPPPNEQLRTQFCSSLLLAATKGC